MTGLPSDMVALLVGKDPEAAQHLLTGLAPEIKFPASEFVPSVLKAVQSMSEDPFSVCFIEDAFPVGELETFFKDIKSMGKLDTCVFVQVRSTLAPDAHRGSLNHLGFATIISSQPTEADREALMKAMRSCFHAQEVKVRKIDISGIMDNLLRKVDKAADTIRRGRKNVHIENIPAELVELHTSFDEEILKNYFEALEASTSKAKPVEIKQLEVPLAVLGRQLPGLSKSTYVGTSHRVWEKLAKKHGKKTKKA